MRNKIIINRLIAAAVGSNQSSVTLTLHGGLFTFLNLEIKIMCMRKLKKIDKVFNLDGCCYYVTYNYAIILHIINI